MITLLEDCRERFTLGWVVIMPQNTEQRRCKARSKRTGEQCKKPAYPGYTVCYYHGANPTNRGGAPKGSKNALKTGEYETIHYDTLDAEEKRLWGRINTKTEAQLDEELRLITIRERRMLQRIANLAGVDMTVVERIYDIGNDPDGDDERRSVLKEKALGTLGQIQAIEEALTRVQAQKARLLELKHRMEAGVGPDHPDLKGYVEALEGAAVDVWGDEQ